VSGQDGGYVAPRASPSNIETRARFAFKYGDTRGCFVFRYLETRASSSNIERQVLRLQT
jgi:hypothetical protein